MLSRRLSVSEGMRLNMFLPKAMLTSMVFVLAGLLLFSQSARADFGLSAVGGTVVEHADRDGYGNAVVTQAGAHPDITTRFEFNRHTGPDGLVVPDGNLRTAVVSLPPGLVANPTVAPTCPGELMEGTAEQQNTGACPAESQVGIAYVETRDSDGVGHWLPLFNISPPRGVAARLSFMLSGVVTNIDARVRSAPEVGVDATASYASQSLPLYASRVTLWGVPADPIHDDMRGGACADGIAADCRASTSPLRAFVTLPTSCPAQPHLTRIKVASWQNPDVFRSYSFDHDFDGMPMKTDGCGKLGFEPAASVALTTTAPDAPTGLDVEITSPQNLDNPSGLANAQLKDVKVTLPEGMTINPGSADGLQACSDAQLGLDDDAPVSCPDGAKIGTVTATSPLLTEELSGDVFIRSQASDDPESGEMFRMALVLENAERGVRVKLPGAIRVNKDSGRIVTEFDDNPQVPVDHISLHLKAGPRAPLATPTTCGDKTIDLQFTSWAGHDESRQSSFTVPCTAGLGGFAPSLKAGVADPTAGAFAPFSLAISKPDGNAPLMGLSMTLPAGLVAKLKGNLGTQVGTAKAFAGPGSNPFMLSGRVYLEGAYGNAPFSLRVVVPAKAGPFDLGEVVVRQKIYVDPITAQVTVVSDPLPTIVKGVPVRLQRLEVNVDKPNFIVNPTSCAAKAFSGTMSAVDGRTAPINVRFQVGACASLDLKPSLALSLSGKGQTTDGKHPAVTANLTQPFSGQANLKKVAVALPLSLALDPDNANGLCEFVDGSKATPTCPKASIVGTAIAVTPILDEPLSGPVYFVKNIRKDPKSGREIRTLPKLVIPLTGQNGLKLTLTGTSNVEDDQLVTTFDNIPDAPVSSFKLNINGGKGGILTVSDADICKSTQIADQQIDGHNTKQADTNVFIQTPSCPLKVLSKKVGTRSVAIKVGGLGAGKVTVTGKGIKKTSKTITKSTVATIIAKRTKGKPGKVTVSFVPKGIKKVKTATAALTANRR
jgi:hypothetical protein